MHDKIKELTDKIHREGLEKANKDAAEIIGKAKADAEEMINKAKKEAESIINNAQADAEKRAHRINSEIRLSSQQAILNLKKQISELIQTTVLKEPLSEAFNDKEFIKKLVETLVQNWTPETGEPDLRVMLPKDQLDAFDRYLKDKSMKILNKGISLSEYQGSGSGFEIQQKNGHFKINITDEAFEIFLKEHIKPQTLEFLYGGAEL
ncbi:MAG: V-type ATP synthase subunit E family protein [Bacteroidales bacterium]